METYYTTTNGKRIEVEAVPPLLLEEVRTKAQKEVELPPIPFYTVELPDGSSQSFQHDGESIMDPATTDAERKIWKIYQDALRRQAAHSASKVLELFFARGIVIPKEEITSGSWRDLQEYFGVTLPENPIAAKIHYIRTELLTTADDIQGVVKKILEASGIDPDILEAARNSFRGDIRVEEDTPEGTGGAVQSAQAGEVAHQRAIPRLGNSESLGAGA